MVGLRAPYKQNWSDVRELMFKHGFLLVYHKPNKRKVKVKVGHIMLVHNLRKYLAVLIGSRRLVGALQPHRQFELQYKAEHD